MNEIWDGQGAACRDKTDVFFSEEPGDVEQAQGICATCPVIEPCLEYARTNRVEHGVWGGELFRNGPPASLLIQKAWQEAEELGLRDPDDTRRAALPIFITSDGHIRDFLEDAMRRRPGDDGASLGEGGGQLFRNRIQAVKRRWGRLSKAVQAARQLTKEG